MSERGELERLARVCWDNGSDGFKDTLELLRSKEEPTQLQKDLIIEIYRRTLHYQGFVIEAQNEAKGYWKRQFTQKNRSVSTEKIEKSPLLLERSSALKSPERNETIHQFIDQLRTENLRELSENNQSKEKQLTLDEQANRSIDKIEVMVRLGYLEIISHFILGGFKRQPWVPLLHSAFILFSKALSISSYEDQSISLLQTKTNDDGETLLNIILTHFSQLPKPTMVYSISCAIFLNSLYLHLDKTFIQTSTHLYHCETLLKVFGNQIENFTSNKLLSPFIDYYNVPVNKFLNKKTHENLIIENFFLRFLYHLKTFISFTKKNQNSNQNSSSDPQLDVDIYSTYFLEIFNLFYTMTSQTLTGRYISWILAMWFDDQNVTFYTFRLALYITKFIPHHKRRKYETTIYSTIFNITHFLKINDHLQSWAAESSLVKASSLKDPNFRQLLGIDSIYPNESIIRDLLNNNFFLPQMNLRYLSQNDYLLRNFILIKSNIAIEFWQSFLRNRNENCHLIDQFSSIDTQKQNSPENNNTKLIAILLPSTTPLIWNDSQFPSNNKKKEGNSSNNSSDFMKHLFLVSFSPCGEFVNIFKGVKVNNINRNINIENKRYNEVIIEMEYNEYKLLLSNKTKITHIFLTNPAQNAFSSILEGIQSLYKNGGWPSWFEELITGRASSNSIDRIASSVSSSLKEFQKMKKIKFNSIYSFGDLKYFEKNLFHTKSKKLSSNDVQKSSKKHYWDSSCEYCSLSFHQSSSDNEITNRTPINMTFDCPFLISDLNCHSNTNLDQNYKENEENEKKSVGQKKKEKEIICEISLEDNSKETEKKKLYITQQAALFSSLFRRISLIIGPPGTGKTEVTTRIIFHLSLNSHPKSPKRILILSQTNNALDQLIARLYKLDIPVVRIGSQTTNLISSNSTIEGWINYYQSTVKNTIKYLTNFPKGNLLSLGLDLQTILQNNEGNFKFASKNSISNLLKFVDKDFFTDYSNLYRNNQRNSAEIQERVEKQILIRYGIPKEEIQSTGNVPNFLHYLNTKFMELHKAYLILGKNKIDQKIDLINNSQIVGATCSGASMNNHLLNSFEIVVIEEAGKVMEAESLIAFGKKLKQLILVGDDLQMRSLVQHEKLKSYSLLDQSLFARLQRIGVKPIQLNFQTRALPRIADLYRWRYESLYDHDSVTNIQTFPFLINSLQFIDIKPTKSDYNQNAEINRTEIDHIFKTISYLQLNAISPSQITILTPYRKQKIELQKKFHSPNDFYSSLDICTIDEYQGEEKDIIIISLTVKGKVPSSFLCDPRRLNVLTSRAKSALLMFGDLYSFTKSGEWFDLIEKVKSSQQKEFVERYRFEVPSSYQFHSFYVTKDITSQSKLEDKEFNFERWNPINSLHYFDNFLKVHSPVRKEEDVDWIVESLNKLRVD